MGEVVNMFKKPAPVAPGSTETGPTVVANAGLLAAHGMEGLRQMEEQGAAAKVLAALLFYAHQGQDQGLRARRAVVAMQELLNGQPGPETA